MFKGIDFPALTEQIRWTVDTSQWLKGLDFSALTKQVQFAIDTSSWFKSIDVDQIVRSLSALAETDAAVAPLTREQARLLWGWLVYAVVWAIVLQLVLTVMSVSETSSSVLGLIVTMTGVSGHSVASKARKVALEAFDNVNPPGDQSS